LQVEHAELSLIGDRAENQDRVVVSIDDHAALLLVVDGMGGHLDGARAAEVASQTVMQAFSRVSRPVFDPQGFLHLAIGRAHANLVALGAHLSVEARPRATCAVCLVQDSGTFWAHVGDSRIYLLRDGQVLARTRDHSHVELLVQEGLITEAEVSDHPMRNYVECCLGGDARMPGMSITGRQSLRAGDALLVCSDGFWSGVGDDDIGGLSASEAPLYNDVRRLGEQAVRACGPYADNTTAAALRFGGPAR
jgi:serine/threonine protein phosphatase PrpC